MIVFKYCPILGLKECKFPEEEKEIISANFKNFNPLIKDRNIIKGRRPFKTQHKENGKLPEQNE